IESGDRVAHDKAGTTEWQRDAAATVALGRATATVGHDAVGRMTTHAEQAVRANSRKEMALAVIGIILALAISWLLGRRLVQRLRSLAGLVAATAAGDFGGRYDGPVNDEVGLLGAAFNDMADNLSRLLNRLEADAERDGFGSQLMEAFEMADEEGDAHAIVERAMNEISATAPMELLLADSSRAHLERVASSPLAGSPGCPVESPFPRERAAGDAGRQRAVRVGDGRPRPLQEPERHVRPRGWRPGAPPLRPHHAGRGAGQRHRRPLRWRGVRLRVPGPARHPCGR